VLSQLFLGWFADRMAGLDCARRGQWDPAFTIYGGILLLGACGRLRIDSTRPAVPSGAERLALDRPPCRGKPAGTVLRQPAFPFRWRFVDPIDSVHLRCGQEVCQAVPFSWHGMPRL
jgi:hypothetical protein